jgi:hypothetical protein
MLEDLDGIRQGSRGEPEAVILGVAAVIGTNRIANGAGSRLR